MSEISEMPIKEIITIASPVIKSLVENIITPKLSKLKSRFLLDYKKYHVPSEEHFTEYFHRTYKRLSIINTLVFNNSQRLLQDIYIPLTLKNNHEKGKKIKIEEYPHDLAQQFEKILITDTAGMGKSTLMKKLFLDIIDRKCGIPILIELRRLSKEKMIIQEIHEQLNALNKDFDSDLLFELIKEGEFIFILDGFDEISLSNRDFVTTDLQQFIAKCSLNKFFLTSRPENALTSFGDFQHFSIEPLKKKEAFELLRKYDKQGQVSSLLIKKLEDKDMSNIEEFLTNPLLVSLLFTAFEHKQVIPFKKYLFYRQVYDANFESHDLTKGDSFIRDKYSGLEIDDFHRILRHIGFQCFKKQKIEFTKDELLLLIKESKRFCVGLTFNESDFLKDILSTVPLFTQDGNYFRWAHKSLQEYFAAQFIYLDSKDQQKKILEKLFESKDLEKFINLLDLYYDIDFKAFRNVIIYKLLQSYFSYLPMSYNKQYFNIPTREIIFRQNLSFFNRIFLFKAVPKEDTDIMDDERFERMIEKYMNLYEVRFTSFSGGLAEPKDTENVFCLLAAKPLRPLYSLLSKKKNPLVFSSDVYNIFTADGPMVTIKYDFEEEFKLYEITDDQQSLFNNESNFQSVNILAEMARLSSSQIDQKVALELLKEIEIDLVEEGEEDFLLDNF